MPEQQMLIDYVPGEECRIAVVEDGKLDEYYHERASAESHVSNIYQGVVTNVEPSISAAFIDFGLERNGFLHITDVHPKYFPGEDREAFETVGHKTRHGDRPGIERCFKKGDPVTVQVLKEGIGNKGPTVTSYLSIPGRFLVMMPDMQQLGVSRKVEDEEQRREMKQLLKSLEPPKEFGFIIRTAGMGQSKVDLKKDLSYLVRLWKDIEERVAGDGGGGKSKKKGRRRARVTRELYTESDLVIRTIRDVFTPDIDRVVINHPEAAKRAHDFLAVSNPRAKSKVVFYDDPVPLFHRFGLEQQIDNIGSRTVELPSGGALVIDPTEALVAVDVNSGRSRSAKTSESNAFETNKEAVDEIARQLRLRDLGGLVVLDLIDMYQQKHRRAIEGRLKKNFLKDKARTRVGGISQFGMLELTRQRMRSSLTEAVHQECAHCGGRGHTKSVESVVLNVMRQLAMVMQQPQVARLELTISPDVAFHLLNRKRAEMVALEAKWQKAVTVRVGGGSVDYVQVSPLNEQGATLAPTTASAIPQETATTFRDVATLDDADLEAWMAPVELQVEDPDVLGGHARAGGIDDAAPAAAIEEEDGGSRRGRSRGGRGRDRDRDDSNDSEDEDSAGTSTDESADRGGSDDEDGDRPKRRRRRRGRNRGGEDEDQDQDQDENENRDRDRNRGGNDGGSSSESRRDEGRKPEPAPRRDEPKLPTGPHRDPLLDFEFDPQAHPLDRAREYAEHRLRTGAGDGPLPEPGSAAKRFENATETASVPVGGGIAVKTDDSGPQETSERSEPSGRSERPKKDRAAREERPQADASESSEDSPDDDSGEGDGKRKRKRRRRRRGRSNGGDSSEASGNDTGGGGGGSRDSRPRDEHGDIDGNVRTEAPTTGDEPAEEDDDRGNRVETPPAPSPKRSRKKAAKPEPEAEVAEAQPEAEADAKPKPKRTRKPKAAPAEAAETLEPEPEAKPEKPARKPRARKAPVKKAAKKEAPAATEAADDSDAAPAKKKRRSRKKAPADPADEGGDGDTAGDGA